MLKSPDRLVRGIPDHRSSSKSCSPRDLLVSGESTEEGGKRAGAPDGGLRLGWTSVYLGQLGTILRSFIWRPFSFRRPVLLGGDLLKVMGVAIAFDALGLKVARHGNSACLPDDL